MRVDIYRRAELAGQFSYLAVPEGRVIPDEATNTDWEVEALAIEADEAENSVPLYTIMHVSEQLAEKGYAMTALR